MWRRGSPRHYEFITVSLWTDLSAGGMHGRLRCDPERIDLALAAEACAPRRSLGNQTLRAGGQGYPATRTRSERRLRRRAYEESRWCALLVTRVRSGARDRCP